MGYLDETLRRLGATESQINSSTAKLFEKAMIEDSEFCQKVAADALNRLADRFDQAESIAAKIDATYQRAKESAELQGAVLIRRIKTEADRFAEESEKCEKARNATKDIIYDADLNEAVKAYKAVLSATKEVFGEFVQGEITQAAIVAAINAGSYVAWRGIMGPAEGNTKGKETRRSLGTI